MKLSAKVKRQAAQIAAASVRSTVDGMIGSAPSDLLQALIAEARILEQKAGATSAKQRDDLHDTLAPMFMKIKPVDMPEEVEGP